LSSSRFKVAAAQFAPVFLDRTETVRKACDAIARAAEAGAHLVVFPEAFVSGYPDWVWVVPNHRAPLLNELYARLIDNAVSVPDESTDRLCEAAQRAGICVVMGMHERNAEASGASVFNSLLFIDEKGHILGKRRKLVPTGAERLVWAQGDGSTLQVFDTSVGRLGGLICWESYMPLARQALYAQGVQILVTPTWDKSPNWLASLRHIAREGGMFIVNCCQALRMDDVPGDCGFKELYPSDREWINVGNSCVIDPKGEVIAGPLEAAEGLVIAEIDLRDILAAKRMFDVAGHYSRPDVFDFSVRGAGPGERIGADRA
jgi:nitrilase